MDHHALPSRIAAEIAALIALGDIAAEAHLSTQEFANRFEVSRTPVREALNLLSSGVWSSSGRTAAISSSTLTPRARRRRAQAPSRTSAPSAYYQLAEDWLRDAVPAEVTENLLLERYQLDQGATDGDADARPPRAGSSARPDMVGVCCQSPRRPRRRSSSIACACCWSRQASWSRRSPSTGQWRADARRLSRRCSTDGSEEWPADRLQRSASRSTKNSCA